MLTLALLYTCAAAWAQGPKMDNPPPSPQEMIQRAKTELDLSPDQVQQWEAIHQKYEATFKQQTKIHEAMREMGKELEATLTEDQLEKFKKHKPPHKGFRGRN